MIPTRPELEARLRRLSTLDTPEGARDVLPCPSCFAPVGEPCFGVKPHKRRRRWREARLAALWLRDLAEGDAPAVVLRRILSVVSAALWARLEST